MNRAKFTVVVMAFTVCGILLNACADYRFTVNDRTVYTPDALFDDYEITDNNLHNCVKQTIEDQKITGASQLIVLSCSHAGIRSLAGLETFSALSSLELSNNHIASLTALFDLLQLEIIHLDGNSKLPCDQVANLARRVDIRVVKPAHCT